MRKNWLVTVAGIMAALGGVPVLVAQATSNAPAWWGQISFGFTLSGIIGIALLGWSAKGQDEHSTVQQVEVATEQKKDGPQGPIHT